MSDVREADLYKPADLAWELGAERIASAARTVAERIADGRFYVACVGQFKRGKSTLLNALIGQAILPAGVLPVTSVPTILRFGEIPSARLRRTDLRWTDIAIDEIEQYVSEEKNPENVKGVAALEIFVPSRLLASGMCLVDTPGLGSTFAGNSKSTREFLPHMDAMLVVVGADPPISGEELDLVERAAGEIHELLFVLNKADRVSPSDLSTASDFARRVLEQRIHRKIPEIFEISALERLEGRGPERGWSKLRHALERLVQCSGKTLVDEAAERSIRRISVHLLKVIDEDRRALLQPLELTKARIADLRRTVERAGEAVRDLGALLASEQERLSRSIVERRKLFLDQVRGAALDELRKRLPSLPARPNGVAFRREAMSLAQEIARSRVVPWLESEELHVEEIFRGAMRRFIELANDFLRGLEGMGLSRMDDFPLEMGAEAGLRSKSRFRFHMIERVAAPASPLLLAADTMRGLAGATGAIRHDAAEFLEQLLEVNSARVQSDMDERLREARKALESKIRSLLHEVETMAENALARARSAQSSGAAAVETQLSLLQTAEREIHRIKESRGDPGSLPEFPH